MLVERVVIVGGCGHVGLPLGLMLATRGFTVTLLDVDSHKIREVNSGRVPFLENGADELIKTVVGTSLCATADAKCLRDADAVITVVGTPVDRHLNPNVTEIYVSTDEVISQMRDGVLLILRSTVYPGVTQLIHERIRALGRDIPLAFCPERIAEGKAIEELTRLPQLISAFDHIAMQMARSIFEKLTPHIIELDPLEAELAKLFTNSWRYLNFAISNQFYLLAESYGVNFYRIYDAVTRDYPRMKSFAKAGFAAGPCLLKDTLQLGAFARNNFFLGHAAMLINEGMPNFIVDRLRPLGLSRLNIAILGIAFKADSDDTRESLGCKLKNLLRVEAKEVFCADPFVNDPTLVTPQVAIEKSDIVILGAPHSVYRDLNIPVGKTVIDIWNFWDSTTRQASSEVPVAIEARQ